MIAEIGGNLALTISVCVIAISAAVAHCVGKVKKEEAEEE